jgi:histidine ammonia-lyase
MTVRLKDTLTWPDIARISHGESLELAPNVWARIEQASAIVDAIVESGIRAYGITTGVGALADRVVSREQQAALSRHIVLSHAAGVGPALPRPEVRAIIAAQINNFAHGHSGVRPDIIRYYLKFLETGLTPVTPSRGSVGYLTHNAAIALLLIGEGRAELNDEILDGRAALEKIGLAPLTLRAKEGLSLVNGSACATGLSSLAVSRMARLLDWADAIATLTLEAAGAQVDALSEFAVSMRPSPGSLEVAQKIETYISGSGLIAAAKGRRTQDALSLRAIPHVHGAARDVFAAAAVTVNQELASVTDNPFVSGTPDQPHVQSEAHAVAPHLAQAMDSLAIALAQLSIMSERRLDRLVSPLVSGLPAFLAKDAGAHSGFMIAQYTAAGLANENRRLAMPASVDGGVTSALQEDFLANPTPAVNKLLAALDNAEYIFAIELMAAAQAQDFVAGEGQRAPTTEKLYKAARRHASFYADDRPLNPDIEALRAMLHASDWSEFR